MSGKPPGIAIWILEHAVTSPAALAGDLLELYAGGRSAAWLWWQVVMAATGDVVRQARQHPLLTLSAALLAWLGASRVASLAFAIHNLAVILTAYVLGPYAPLEYRTAFSALLSTLGIPMLTAYGWLLGRLHRRAHLSGVVVFVLVLIVLQAIFTRREALAGPRFWLWSGSLILGALLSARPHSGRPTLSPENAA